MGHKILVLAEDLNGEIIKVSWEAIGFAQTLADIYNSSVSILMLGKEADNLASEIAKKTGMEVLSIADEYGRDYSVEVYSDIMVQVIRQVSPFFVLMGHSYRVNDFAPQLAAMLEKGFISNCVGFNGASEEIVFMRSVYGGKLIQKMNLKGEPPYLISLQQGRFSNYLLRDMGCGKIVRLDIRLTNNLGIKRRIIETILGVQGKIDLSKAEIIVAGGRGMGSKENFRLIFELAEVLRASVGASRPVIDSGWLAKEHQIGSSGRSVAPKVYIACGISGEVQHLVGISNAECIVAINRDPHAPIFQVADYGIVGDVFTIVPAMTQLIKERGSFNYRE